MKKITTILAMLSALVVLSGTSAKALEIKTGVSLNSMAVVANAQEKLKDSGRVTNKNDAIATSFASGFVELSSDELMGLGFGVAYAPEVVSLNDEARNIQPSATGDTGLQKIAADVDDLISVYVTLPVGPGAYVKAGMVRATLNTKESLATGSKYPNIDLEGYTVGGGYEGDLGDMLFWRAEGTYQHWDDIAASGSEAGGSGNTNKITAELGGVTGSLSLGMKF
jgi:hypothetical protein